MFYTSSSASPSFRVNRDLSLVQSERVIGNIEPVKYFGTFHAIRPASADQIISSYSLMQNFPTSGNNNHYIIIAQHFTHN